jgi:phosphoglycerate dehydrogenase-like enzyme
MRSEERITVVVGFPPNPDRHLVASLEGAAPDAEVLVTPYSRGDAAPTPEQRAALARAHVVLAWDLPRGLPELAPNLRWVQAIGAGVEHFADTGLFDMEQVVLTNAVGVAAVPIAEFVIARLLAVWKRFDDLAARQRAHTWDPTFGRTFQGSTVGIVGLGAIGRAIAERVRALGARVLAIRRSYRPGDSSPVADELFGPGELHAMLGACDAVVLCAPSTPETKNMFDAAAFAAMAPGSVFCNVARGAMVDEDALLGALRRGHLRAAVLDVVKQEPLPSESPLWDAPNLLLSPHSSASLDRYMDSLFALFADNLERFVRGEPLRNVVDLRAGY